MLSCLIIEVSTSCVNDYDTEPLTNNTIISSITIDEDYEVYTLVKGEEYNLHYSISPDNVTNPGVYWVSGNEEVATVDLTGKVTALSVGTSVITVKPTVGFAEGVSDAITISVVDELALTKSIEITNDDDELTIMQTQSMQIKTQTVPEKPSFYLLSWKSSDETVATVDENGQVFGISSGTATITATTTDGTNLSASTLITVKAIIPVQSFEISSVHNELAKGEMSVLKYSVEPSDATVTALEWNSSDATIASVEKRVLDGKDVFVIKGGVNSGTATLTASITYLDGSPSFEKTFEVSVVDGKINDEFIFSAGCFEGGEYRELKDGKLMLSGSLDNKGAWTAKCIGTMTFYPSKYPIYAVKTFFDDDFNKEKIPSMYFNIWNYNPRIAIGYYGGNAINNAKNLYKISMTPTSDGGYVTYVDFSNTEIGFPGATADYMNNGVLKDGITLDRCENLFYDTYYNEEPSEPFAIDWVKTFKSIEEYKNYLRENEGVTIE